MYLAYCKLVKIVKLLSAIKDNPLFFILATNCISFYTFPMLNDTLELSFDVYMYTYDENRFFGIKYILTL